MRATASRASTWVGLRSRIHAHASRSSGSSGGRNFCAQRGRDGLLDRGGDRRAAPRRAIDDRARHADVDHALVARSPLRRGRVLAQLRRRLDLLQLLAQLAEARALVRVGMQRAAQQLVDPRIELGVALGRRRDRARRRATGEQAIGERGDRVDVGRPRWPRRAGDQLRRHVAAVGRAHRRAREADHRREAEAAQHRAVRARPPRCRG